jgi:hypothetical protein
MMRSLLLWLHNWAKPSDPLPLQAAAIHYYPDRRKVRTERKSA